jgi:hypothetical protein
VLALAPNITITLGFTNARLIKIGGGAYLCSNGWWFALCVGLDYAHAALIHHICSKHVFSPGNDWIPAMQCDETTGYSRLRDHAEHVTSRRTTRS